MSTPAQKGRSERNFRKFRGNLATLNKRGQQIHNATLCLAYMAIPRRFRAPSARLILNAKPAQIQYRSNRPSPRFGGLDFSANTSAPLLHIALMDGHDAVTGVGHTGSGRGKNSDNEEVSWSSDLEVHVPFTGHGP
jgi:hypothetical protein